MQHIDEYILERQNVSQYWEDFFNQITEKKNAHDNYIHDGIVPDPDVINPGIVESWRRSLDFGLNSSNMPPVYVPEKVLEEKFIKYQDLISAADPILAELAVQFSTSRFTVDLYDRDLCLIKMYGTPSELDKRPAYVKPGLLRSEDICGTTAMSYALQNKRAVQLVGGEHFSDAMTDNVCTASLIMIEGQCVGLINVVEHQWERDSRTLGTLISLAKLVEYNYAQQKLKRELISEVAFNDGILKAINDGLMVISAAGKITKVNVAACKLLGISRSSVENMNVKDVFGADNPFDSAIRLGIPIKEQEISLRINGKVKRFIGNVQPVFSFNKLVQVIVTIKDMKSMRTIIKSVGGWNATYTFDNIIGNNPVFKQAVAFAEQTAIMDSNTLLVGESGTGKELFAHSIHNAGPFREGPFVSINCSSIPMGLLESELFGYEDGAFTGAKKSGQPGKFELAEGGTLFLDEINSIPLDMQVKLLRVLQDKKITRIGGTNNIELHVKIIAASNEDLWELVQKGQFRADLFYRLNVITIHIPPLHQHVDDIPIIANNIVERLSRSYNEEIQIAEAAYPLLMKYRWPGNVRELENFIERGFVNARLRKSDKIDSEDLQKVFDLNKQPLYEQTANTSNVKAAMEPIAEDLNTAEKEIIRRSLQRNSNNISATARELGMSRNTLYQRIKKYGLSV